MDAHKKPDDMIELLSRDHTILERPYMIYCPFGIDKNGKKVQDVSGISVRAMVTFLEQYITQRDGAAAGKEAVQQACELLNSRIRDAAYHVNPKFLRNVWNSYSYEFTMYLREFCEQITGDPEFHFKIGQRLPVVAADDFITPLNDFTDVCHAPALYGEILHTVHC